MRNNPYQLIKATEKLPSPKGVALKILQLTEDSTTTVEEISAVIESDPALSLKLLKIVNSPLAGLSRKVGSVTRATVMLGFRAVADLTLCLSLLSDHRKGACAAFDYELFWSQSLARAVTACELAKLLRLFSPDEAFTCALLSQIGRLALASAYPERYAEVLAIATDDPDEINQYETEVFGIDHNSLTAEIMSDWHLPKLFVLAAMNQDKSDSVEPSDEPCTPGFAKLIHLSGLVAEVLTGSLPEADSLSVIHGEAVKLGIDPCVLDNALDDIRDQWRQAAQIFSIATHAPVSF